MNNVSVIRVSRCGITRGTLSGKHVLTLIWVIMTGGSFKIVSNWAVLTIFPLSSAFYSGETLGANIFVSWPCLCRFHSFLGSPCPEGNCVYKGPLFEPK